MKTRERFLAVLNFQPFDRLPIIEWANWWDKTVDRWHSEGLSENLNGCDIMRHLDMDIHYQDWIRTISENCPKAKSHGSGIIKNMDDYNSIKKHLYPSPVIDKNRWKKWVKEQQNGDAVLWFTLDGFFWFPRQLFGIENHMYAFYDHPELMHQINNDLAEFHLKVVEELCSIGTPDFMTFAEDLSYNKGPMLSKEMFSEFLTPYYSKVVPRLKEHGIKIIVDSDGDISKPAFWFEDAGIEGILPLERQAGVDIAQLRKEHPKQIYIGAYDKMVMFKGEEAMRKEFERLLPVAKKGGFIISCDHQTPPQVSFENYKIYLRLFREYAKLAAS